MKSISVLLFCLFLCNVLTKAQEEFEIPEDVSRIVFLGNSITYGGKYVDYIETCLFSKYPERNFEIINMGLPSETVSGLSEPNHAKGQFPRPVLSERLDRILEELNPDLIFACYGMNDGVYLPFDDERFNRYREGLDDLHEKSIEAGAGIIHITPPVYDERKGAAYANLLDIYSSWLLSQKYTRDWDVIDLHWPMRKYLEDKRTTDSAFRYAKDGVHPDAVGHWIMARSVLIYLGMEEISTSENIEDALKQLSIDEELLRLVNKRSSVLKDAWLTHIGHKRPAMKSGLPLKEALKEARGLEKQIRKLRKKLNKDNK